MALSIYMGNPGAGKTYTAISLGVVPALKLKRRVVTNIAGIKLDKLAELVGFDVSEYLVQVTDDQVASEEFYLDVLSPESPSIVKPGDLVILDECWQWFRSGTKISERTFAYFRKHRHFIHPETSVSSDIWLLTQSFDDIQRSVRSIADFCVTMTKLKMVGKNNQFRVDFYAGGSSVSRRAPFNQAFHFYESQYFDCYSSYSGGGGESGVESETDDRTNFWNKKFFFGLLRAKEAIWVVLLVALLGLGGGIFVLQSMTKHVTDGSKTQKTVSAPNPLAPVTSVNTASASSVPGSSLSQPVSAQPVQDPLVASDNANFRLIGVYQFNSLPVAVISDASGVYRYVLDFQYVHAGPASHVVVNGKKIAFWTGGGAQK